MKIFLKLLLSVAGLFVAIKILNYNFNAENDAKNLLKKYLNQNINIEILELSSEFYKNLHASGWPPMIAFKTDSPINLDFKLDCWHGVVDSHRLPQTFAKYYSNLYSDTFAFIKYEKENFKCTENFPQWSGVSLFMNNNKTKDLVC